MRDRAILRPDRCLIVGEVAQAHDGSLGTAHAYIDAIADAGADAVKFQTHIASAESTPQEPWRVKFSPQDATRYDYWRRMEFTEEQWHGLKTHADERGLFFLSSPFSPEAADLLSRVGVAAWKIASGEVGNVPMYDRIARTRLPVFISTGMSPLDEVDYAVQKLRTNQIPFAVLQCTSMYPTPAEKVGLNVITEFRKRYGCPVGLSDHSGTIYPGLAAAALGCDILEVHAVLSRRSFGPDAASSVTIDELRTLVDGVRFIETARSNPVEKDVAARELSAMRQLFNKSVVARVDLQAGTVLSEDHLALKKPGTGISADRLPQIIGRMLANDVVADHVLQESDLL